MEDIILMIIVCVSVGSWAGVIGTLFNRKFDYIPVIITYFASAFVGLFLPTAIGGVYSNYGDASMLAAMAFCSFLPAQLGVSMLIGGFEK